MFSKLHKILILNKTNKTIIMPSNVEIKAKVKDYVNFQLLAKQLSQSDGLELKQEDTFFNVPNGRLKLRQQANNSMLIAYEREDCAGPKRSNFHITEINNPEDLKKTLGMALGVKGVVKKTRLLYMIGQTRLHLDRVVGLGDFMELEVVLRDDQTTEEGQAIADDLMKKLNIEAQDLLECAYMDLLLIGVGDK